MSYEEAKRAVEDSETLDEVMHAEEYVPPHKMAGFVPYDAVISIVGDDAVGWDEDRAREEVSDAGVNFDEFVGFGENDDPRLDGKRLAYVTFHRR